MDLRGQDLSRTNLREVDLSEADLSRANLGEADLSRENVGETDLSRTKLDGMYPLPGRMFGVNVSGAELSSAQLVVNSLMKVMWTSATRWPSAQAEQIRLASHEVSPGVFILNPAEPAGRASEPNSLMPQ